MRTVQMRDAKARLSEMVELASNGEQVTITSHGTAKAVLVSVEDAQAIRNTRRPRVVDVLLDFPGDGTEFERDYTPIRDVDL
jgi:antitoxin Phd